MKAKIAIEEYQSSLEIQSEFNNSLYEYLLYLCGGDFSLFEDKEILNDYIQFDS